MQTNDELSMPEVIRNAIYQQECFKVSIDLFNFLKNIGMDAFITWKDGYFNDDGTVGEDAHVWVVVNVLGVMIPLETQLFGIPSPIFDYSNYDMMTNDRDVIEKEYLLNLAKP
ncbi:MAG: hypothetical protein J7K40_05495 [candidate division Zixibacteria bacterium]|nr:hypothetical protein [candidate division Zixibacteria bacterium]